MSQVLLSSLQFRHARYSPQTMNKCLKYQHLLNIHWTKKLGIITFSIIVSGILNLTVYFNTSAYVAIIGLSFDKNLIFLSKSQTELCSVK